MKHTLINEKLRKDIP